MNEDIKELIWIILGFLLIHYLYINFWKNKENFNNFPLVKYIPKENRDSYMLYGTNKFGKANIIINS